MEDKGFTTEVQRAQKMDDCIQTVGNPAGLEWQEVTKVAHYYLSVNALSACNAQAGMPRPMQVREDEAPYGEDC